MVTVSNWRETGTLTVGQTLEFECPGHNGDGRFHKHEAMVVLVIDNPLMVEVFSQHWPKGYKFFTPKQGRDNTFYLEEVSTRAQ